MHVRPFAAPPGQGPGAPVPLPAEQTLMLGLAKGLEGLLRAKPVPPAPKIVCGCGIVPAGPGAGVTRLPPRSARPASRQDTRQDGGPRGQVVHLPVRSRHPVFAAPVGRLTEPRLIRL